MDEWTCFITFSRTLIAHRALSDPGINAINLGRTAAVEIYDAIERNSSIDGTDVLKGMTFTDDYDGSIELRKVVFSYPSRPQDIIFRDFSLKIKPGQAVALVGPSGSGKSSLSKLLLRLYDPIGGRILVGGVRLSEINLKWWRNQIGYVCQEPCFFPGSVRDNIAAGKVEGNATDEEVEAAARAASAHDFIMNLPHGYSTFYSGSSTQLSGKLWCFIRAFHFSAILLQLIIQPRCGLFVNLRCVGGQMQRISIARALIRHPKVLLLGKCSIFLDN